MKLAFFGSSEFAIPSLRALRESVTLVVTQPDKPVGRKFQLQTTPVKAAAVDLGLPVVEPITARDPDFVSTIAAAEFDALVVAAYGQILSTKLLNAAKRGGINLHGSVLPRYRGAAPIQRAIINGDQESGVTLMQMDRGMDTGDIIAIKKLDIGDDDTATDVFLRLGLLAADLAVDWMPRIVDGDYPRTPQDDTLATYAPKIQREDCLLDWNAPANANYDRYRGVTEHPGAVLHTRFGNLKLKVARLRHTGDRAGRVMTLRPLVVAMVDQSLELQLVQPEGKGSMSGSDWANGARLAVGDSILAV